MEDELNIDFNRMPKEDFESLCRATINACMKFYSDPKNVEEFEKWKAEKEQSSKEDSDGLIFQKE